MSLYNHFETIRVCYLKHYQFDKAKSKNGKIEWVFLQIATPWWLPNVYLLDFEKDPLGRRKLQTKDGKIYLMFYGLLLKESLSFY